MQVASSSPRVSSIASRALSPPFMSASCTASSLSSAFSGAVSSSPACGSVSSSSASCSLAAASSGVCTGGASSSYAYVQRPDGQSCAVPSSQAHLYYLQLYGLPIGQAPQFIHQHPSHHTPPPHSSSHDPPSTNTNCGTAASTTASLSSSGLPSAFSSLGNQMYSHVSPSSCQVPHNISLTTPFSYNVYHSSFASSSSSSSTPHPFFPHHQYRHNTLMSMPSPSVPHPIFYSSSAHLRPPSSAFSSSIEPNSISSTKCRGTPSFCSSSFPSLSSSPSLSLSPSSSHRFASSSSSSTSPRLLSSSFCTSPSLSPDKNDAAVQPLTNEGHPSEHSDSAKRCIESKKILRTIREVLSKLESAVECEFSDFEKLSNAVEQSTKIDKDASKASEDAVEYINARNAQLIDTARKYKELTAECLPDCSNVCLDEISDLLSAGLQSATIALSRRQVEKSDVKTQNNNIQYFFKTLPEPNFVPPESPTMSSFSGQPEALCTQLIEQLQKLRTLEGRRFEEMQLKAALLQTLQTKIVEKNKQYGTHRTSLESLEKALNNKTTEVNRLSGADNYAEMTIEGLQDLCRQINKAMRKIATEQALREIRATNAQGEGLANSPEKETCVVCFEKRWNTILTPCGHVLCDECSYRLNYCPTCRTKITGRQKCIQP